MPNTDRVHRRSRSQPEETPSRIGLDDPVAQLEAIEIRSAEQEVYEALRREITRGLAPGTPLRLAQVAERFQVSTMPVRSAIARLEAEGLVTQRPRRGAVVTELTVDDFTDLYTIRNALEGVAARHGCVELTDDELETMQECHRGLAEVTLDSEDGVDDYLTHEWRLHDICYEAAGRRRLMRLIRMYRRHGERYFRRYLGARLEVEIDVEHQAEFLHACEARDPDRAEAAIRLLFDYTMDRLMPGLIEGTSGGERTRKT
jgi:DNA-binding GntR family transcriptional regulator